jgi:hypothetical protein
MKRAFVLPTLLLAAALALPLLAAPGPKRIAGEARPADAARPPRIQIALLLDTSGSMQGLIDQAKTQLWKVVNEFATLRKEGRRPVLEVALFEYGKPALGAAEGYLRMVLPLTTDLDRVSEELFALTIDGGDEYCGRVIQAAVEGLDWSRNAGDIKTVFIAGNEPFTQGPVDYVKACRQAIGRGIIVNTVHCGARDVGVEGKWLDGARIGEGEYMSIDHNQAVARIDAPQDAEVARLGALLNRTYIPYGAKGEAGRARQEAQDSNAAAAAPAVMAERSLAKAGAQYTNSGWDLADAAREGKLKVEEVDAEALPAEMRGMSALERKDYVASRLEERERIQAEIRKLDQERRKYVEARKKQAGATSDTLDSAVVKAVRSQARRLGFASE